jgi:hypothetical protein
MDPAAPGLMAADLDILFLRPHRPGEIIGHGRRSRKRIKTLLDGLRVPSAGEIPHHDTPSIDETPFFCLLEDDALITTMRITADQLLDSSEALLVIHVNADQADPLGVGTMEWV